MDKKLQTSLPTDNEIETANSEVEEYIERIFNSPEEYHKALNASKFSESIGQQDIP